VAQAGFGGTVFARIEWSGAMRKTAAFAWIALTAFAVAVAWSCGGGDSNDSSPPPPPAAAADVVAIGSITGFGSLYVNGVEYATTAAQVTVDDAPATVGDLRLGQVVELKGQAVGAAHRADVIRYHDNLEGPVSAVDVPGSTFTAMGQTVRITSATIVGDGIVPPSIEGVEVGDVVEVSGVVDADGGIIATWVEIRRDSGPYDVTGPVSALATAQHRFNVNDLVVDYSTAHMLDFPDGAPETGDLVLVKGFNFAGDGAFVATKVELRSEGWLKLEEADEVEIEGVVTRYQSALSFDVAGRATITNSATSFRNGTAADLAPGVMVKLQGRMSAAGLLVASGIEFRHTSAIRVVAPLEAVDPARQTLTALGLAIEVDDSTRYCDRLVRPMATIALADLRAGDWVDLRGFEEPAGSGAVTASRVERIAAAGEVRLRGPFRDPQRPDFRILTVSVSTDEATTRYVLEEGIRLTAEQFFAQAEGELVEAWGSWVAPTLSATRVEIKVVDD